MPTEKVTSIVNPLYHSVYEVMQKHRLFGAWERCASQHISSIHKHLSGREKISILYSGTATHKNPEDVLNLTQNLHRSVSLTTIDLSLKPLISLDRTTFKPVQTDCIALPFADHSFDYITTDFLLSKMHFSTIVSTMSEWGRVIKSDGLITMTAGVKNPQPDFTDKAYDEITHTLYGIHFLPKELLQLIFYSAGLEAKFETAQFDHKPYMYRYFDNLLIFIEARPKKMQVGINQKLYH